MYIEEKYWQNINIFEIEQPCLFCTIECKMINVYQKNNLNEKEIWKIMITYIKNLRNKK